MKNVKVTLVRRTKGTAPRVADKNTNYIDIIASNPEVECHYDDELDPSDADNLKTIMDIAIRQMYDSKMSPSEIKKKFLETANRAAEEFMDEFTF